jgi:hypothetical protein
MTKRAVRYFIDHRQIAFLAIFALSFAIRFSLLIHYRDDILAVGEEPRIAYALISKGEFADPYAIPTGPTAHSTPFFPVLLAGIYKVWGTGFAGQFARCLLIITGYSLLFALYPAFASAFGFPYTAGLAAGFIGALVPLRRSSEVFRGWEEPWAAMALGFLLLMTLKRERSPRRNPLNALWLGLFWGLALYVSFSLFAILAGWLVVDLLRNRTLPALRDGCIILVATIIVLSPWTIRNHRQLHAWIPMRSNLGLELRLSNRDNVHATNELDGDDPSFELHPSQNVNEALLLKEMGEANYNRQALHLAITWISVHPAQFAWLSMQRFVYFWFGPVNHKFEFAVTTCYTLLGFAGLGFVRSQVGEIQFRLWCIVLVCYPLLYYLVEFFARYRVPIDWMIWLSAGLFVSVVIERFYPNKNVVAVRRADPTEL